LKFKKKKKDTALLREKDPSAGLNIDDFVRPTLHCEFKRSQWPISTAIYVVIDF
jgi:hypothetical protein